MAHDSDVPVDLYIAAYADPDAAQDDWEAIQELAEQKVITVEALVLVSRDADGKVHVKDDTHAVGKGTGWGAAGGFVVGMIFPPALVAATAVGAGLGAGAGGLVSHREKKEIKAEVANDLPVGSSGIVVLLEEQWVAEAEKALSKADNISTHKVDKGSVEHAKTKTPQPTSSAVS
jgi:uncharacterized membrane protein